jgi:hypothetical protein
MGGVHNQFAPTLPGGSLPPAGHAAPAASCGRKGERAALCRPGGRPPGWGRLDAGKEERVEAALQLAEIASAGGEPPRLTG